MMVMVGVSDALRRGKQVSNYADLMRHLSHKLEVANYANRNAAIECVTCSEVLIDFEKGDQ